MKKKTILIENETQEKILKDALKDAKIFKELGIQTNKQNQNNEKKIIEIQEIERLEKQLN